MLVINVHIHLVTRYYNAVFKLRFLFYVNLDCKYSYKHVRFFLLLLKQFYTFFFPLSKYILKITLRINPCSPEGFSQTYFPKGGLLQPPLDYQY